MDLTDIYRTFHPIIAQYTFPRIFPRIDHTLHQTRLKNFQNTKIISSTFSTQWRNLVVSKRRKTEKFTNRWILNNTLLTRQRKKSKGKQKKNLVTSKNGNKTYEMCKVVLRGTFKAINASVKKTDL